MSVYTKHEIIGKDIYDRIEAEGAIGTSKVWSFKQNSYITVDGILDIEKLDKKSADELRQKFASSKPNADPHEVENITKVKVSKTPEGNIQWVLNYRQFDFPTVAVGRTFPNDIFSYRQSTEGRFDYSYYFKNEDFVDEQGNKYDDILTVVNSKQIKEVNDKTKCVSVSVASDDALFAQIYVDNKDIKLHDITNKQGHRFEILIRNENDTIPVYRTLSDGTKSKETWKMNDLKNAIQTSRNDYYAKRVDNYITTLAAKSADKDDLENDGIE